MWIAHALTLSRIPIGIVFWLTYGDPRVSLGLIALAAVSDAADGTVARWARRRTGDTAPSAGEWLDPLADKAFIFLVLGAIQMHDPAPWWLVGVLLAREVVLVPLAVLHRVVESRRGQHAFQAGSFGKAATVAEFFAVGALILHSRAVTLLAVAAGALGLAAVVQYVLRANHRLGAGRGDDN